ncbi:MAG: hypothetical protein P4K98_05565 [Bryobacteraceae bacterium]|nr:hypothetical protein [Bryobacteraceae bacterium]
MAVLLPASILTAGTRLRASLSSSARAWVICEAQKIVLGTRYETPQDLILQAEIRERFGPELRTLGTKSSTVVLDGLRFTVLFQALEADIDGPDQKKTQIIEILDTVIKAMEQDEDLQNSLKKLS